MQLKNSKKTFSTLHDLIEDDPFLDILIREIFKEYLEKGGILSMLSALGWEGFRNRLAQAYLYHLRYNKFPNRIVLDEINDVLDFERRFSFLYSEHNSRVFLLGFYLKICQVYMEEKVGSHNFDFLLVPIEVDEILIEGKSKSLNPDWLIMTVWSLFLLNGKEKTITLIDKTKGNFTEILGLIDTEDYQKIISGLLIYGNGVNDTQFFIGEKV
jgi:hypothetical protein